MLCVCIALFWDKEMLKNVNAVCKLKLNAMNCVKYIRWTKRKKCIFDDTTVWFRRLRNSPVFHTDPLYNIHTTIISVNMQSVSCSYL